ncbi:Sabbat [Carabus blaptoides fortunei]
MEEPAKDQPEQEQEIEPEENEREPVQQIEKPLNMSPGALKLRRWLNKTLRIEMSDGRVLIGVFLCTDRDANVILGSCSEYLSVEEIPTSEPRVLGLVMIPGKHIVSIHLDQLEQAYPLDYTNEDIM